MRCNEDVRKFLLLSPHESNSNTIQNDMATIKSQLDIININIDVVVYVTGYVVHHVLKVKKCLNCKILLENEGEESPSTYFAEHQQPRNVLISSYLQIIEDHPKLDISCASGHQLIDLLSLATRSFTNCLFKNTAARLSDYLLSNTLLQHEN